MVEQDSSNNCLEMERKEESQKSLIYSDSTRQNLQGPIILGMWTILRISPDSGSQEGLPGPLVSRPLALLCLSFFLSYYPL